MPINLMGECHQKGLHYIFELLKKKGFNVTPKMNSKGTGINYLIVNTKNGGELKLRVRTRPEDQEGYILNERNQENYDNTFFYIFVDSINKKDPDFWVIPSKIVAKSIKDAHDKWLVTPRFKNKKHNDNPIRVFKTFNDAYYPSNWKESLKKYYKHLDIITLN